MMKSAVSKVETEDHTAQKKKRTGSHAVRNICSAQRSALFIQLVLSSTHRPARPSALMDGLSKGVPRRPNAV